VSNEKVIARPKLRIGKDLVGSGCGIILRYVGKSVNKSQKAVKKILSEILLENHLYFST
jgi:hypothetical protein